MRRRQVILLKLPQCLSKFDSVWMTTEDAVQLNDLFSEQVDHFKKKQNNQKQSLQYLWRYRLIVCLLGIAAWHVSNGAFVLVCPSIPICGCALYTDMWAWTGHQLVTTYHGCFAPFTPVHLMVAEWWQGSLQHQTIGWGFEDKVGCQGVGGSDQEAVPLCPSCLPLRDFTKPNFSLE